MPYFTCKLEFVSNILYFVNSRRFLIWQILEVYFFLKKWYQGNLLIKKEIQTIVVVTIIHCLSVLIYSKVCKKINTDSEYMYL